MGAIAEAIAAYAQPLIDQTDGSVEQLNKAFALSQLCFNLALLPAAAQEESLGEMRPSLAMNDEEFAAFRSSIIDPMIRRHEEMFPMMHQRQSVGRPPISSSWRAPSIPTASAKSNLKIDRYAPCPCNSGEKYKFCCGAKRG